MFLRWAANQRRLRHDRRPKYRRLAYAVSHLLMEHGAQ